MEVPLTLYVRTGCPYCARVLEAGGELGIQFSLKNIADWEVHEELETKGGKVQVPYLIDEATGEAMYEADTIIRYLHETYGKGAIEDKGDTSPNASCPI